MSIGLTTLVILQQLSLPVFASGSGSFAIGSPVLGGAYTIVSNAVTTGWNQGTQTLNAGQIFTSKSLPIAYVSAPLGQPFSALPFSSGNLPESASYQVGVLVGSEVKLSGVHIRDWSSARKIGDRIYSGYRISEKVEGLQVASPVIESRTRSLVGIVIDANDGWIMPADRIVFDLTESCPAISQKVDQRNASRPKVMSWRVGSPPESRGQSGDQVRRRTYLQATFGILESNVRDAILLGHHLCFASMDGVITSFDVNTEEVTWRSEAGLEELPMYLLETTDHGLALVSSELQISWEPGSAFGPGHNNIERAQSFVYRYNASSGDREGVAKVPFSAKNCMLTSELIGGINSVARLSNTSSPTRSTSAATSNRFSLVIPLGDKGSQISTLEIGCRVEGMGNSKSPLRITTTGEAAFAERDPQNQQCKLQKAFRIASGLRPLNVWARLLGKSDCLIGDGEQILLLDCASCHVKWAMPFESRSDPVATEKVTALAGFGKVALVKTDGSSQVINTPGIYSRVAIANGLLLYVSVDGILHTLEIDSGSELKSYDLKDRVLAPPVIAGEDVYVLSESFILTALRDFLHRG